jgi:hypothetical protein
MDLPPEVEILGPIGDAGGATWALTAHPRDRSGIMTVGPTGDPQITPTSLDAHTYVSDPFIWVLQTVPARLVPIDVSTPSAPRFGDPVAVGRAEVCGGTFAVDPAMVVIACHSQILVLERATGHWREHAIGETYGTPVAWCSSGRCFVAALAMPMGSRRPRLWSVAAGALPREVSIADEPASDLQRVADGDGMRLTWRHGTMGTPRARRVGADGTMSGPASDETLDPEPFRGFPEVLSATTEAGTLEVATLRRTEGTEMVQGSFVPGHAFTSIVRFRPAHGDPEPVAPLVNATGHMSMSLIASAGGFAVAFRSFSVRPAYWLLRTPCLPRPSMTRREDANRRPEDALEVLLEAREIRGL